MKIKDKKLKKMVDVADKNCQEMECYRPSLDPGYFTQSQGYRHRSNDYLCRTREIRSCPENPKKI